LAHSGFVTVSGSLPPDEGTRMRGPTEAFPVSVSGQRFREARGRFERVASCQPVHARVVFSRRLGLMRPSGGRRARDATRCGSPR
jgi:hypothetical protein